MRTIAAALSVLLLLSVFPLVIGASSSVPQAVIASAQSVVRVQADYPDGISLGSGFVVKSDGKTTLIATNHHVVEGNPFAISVWIGGEEKIAAAVLLSSTQKDLCILQLIHPVSIPELSLKAGAVSQGDAVYAVGFPGAADDLSDTQAHASEEATITDGIVSAVRRVTVAEYGSPVKLLQINAALNSGNSGGPLFDASGAVVGVNTYGTYDAQGIFGAIETGELLAFMEDGGVAYQAPSAPVGLTWLFAALAAVLAAAAVVGFLLVRKARARREFQNSLTLRQAVSNQGGPYDPRRAVALLLPVARSLASLHAQGKAHLGVSPDGIGIRNESAILLPRAKRGVQPDGFAPPERLKGGVPGGASDVYAFCTTLLFAVTGKPPAEDDLAGLEEDFAQIIARGISLSAQYRPSMQELIHGLSAYAGPEQPLAGQAGEPPKTIVTSAPQNGKKRRLPPKIAAIALPCVLLLLGGVYLLRYNSAVSHAEAGRFKEARDSLFLSSITYLHDRDLLSYIDAGVLLEERQYERSYRWFSELADYRNARELTLESDYRLGAKLADANDFDGAIAVYERLAQLEYKDSTEQLLNIRYRNAVYQLYELDEPEKAHTAFSTLVNEGYKKAAEMEREALYYWAMALIDEGDYPAAYEKLTAIPDYEGAGEALSVLADLIYYDAQDLYRIGITDDAKALFALVDPYLESQDYLTLITARSPVGAASPESTVSTLISLFYFEDAAELLLDSRYVYHFLEGIWETARGSYYFKVEEGSHKSSYDLPWRYSGGTYSISDGVYSIYLKDGESHEEFRFTLLTPDSMDVYCYKNGETYTLYRR